MSGKKCGFRDASEISIRKTFNDHPEFGAQRLGALVARLLATGNSIDIINLFVSPSHASRPAPHHWHSQNIVVRRPLKPHPHLSRKKRGRCWRILSSTY
jgi:hypothetical protein